MSAKFDMIIKGLSEAIKTPVNKTAPYDTVATVTRVEDDTVYVHIPGGIDETPISKTVNCKAGDTVQVRVGGGRAWIVGNATAPPTDDTTAIKASGTATNFITEMVDGIFVHREKDKKNGVRITDRVEIIRDNKTVADYGEEAIIGEATGNNVNINRNGVHLRTGKRDVASFSRANGIILGEQQDIHIGNVDYGEMVDMFEVGTTLSFTLSHELDEITRIFAHCRDTTSGEIISNVDLQSSDYSVSGNMVTISSPLVSDSSLVPEELVVWYTTEEIVTQMSIGKNADIDDAKSFPFVVGNNNETLSPSNVFQINWSGEVYTRGHSLPIGEIIIADINFSTTISAGIDNFTNYARLELPPGIYIITARFGVTPSSSSSGCLGLRICKDERNTAHVISATRQLGNVNTDYYGEIAHSTIVNVTKNTMFYAIASSHYAGTVSARTFKAVCIG